MFNLASTFAFALLAATAWSALSPDGSCGMTKGGANKGYTCPSDIKCCSSSGYCGSGNEFCLNSMGCQKTYSNATAACVDPVNATTISPDGTCGSVGAGKYGYKCPATGGNCCSVAGYCGNTTAHCQAANGCQATYGKCT
ncbi:carbohydrate-binding module family 18 protein [Xylariaceae sp. FL0016]|nr:carbohydrate-binding module family 18 protein [Xylariaceae sp. FL0016]